ncbi:ParB N-terminal domain-containing protein [Candidatus Saccharibacteria bacterium]|nr:MAG: ParB N-terminal domain-containing protein [Candidatus Saccharibacteria bacterium]
MYDVHARPDGEIRYVDVQLVRVNPKKLRKLSQAKIARYLSDYDRGDTFPPIVVEDCGTFYTVRDGRHRFQAQLLAGFRQVAVSLYN